MKNCIPELPLCGREDLEGLPFPNHLLLEAVPQVLPLLVTFLLFPVLYSLAPTALTRVWFYHKQIYVVNLPRSSYLLLVFHFRPIFHTTISPYKALCYSLYTSLFLIKSIPRKTGYIFLLRSHCSYTSHLLIYFSTYWTQWSWDEEACLIFLLFPISKQLFLFQFYS